MSVVEEFLARLLEADNAQEPLSDCEDRGHRFDVLCSSPPEPALVLCTRCKRMWAVSESSPLAAATVPHGPVSPLPQEEPKAKGGTPRRVKGRAPSPPVPPAPAPSPVEEAGAPAGTSEVVGAPVEVDEPVADDARTQDVSTEEPESEELICGNCGGELEGAEFAQLEAKNFKGLQFCRDCLLTCESCASPIDTMEQARLSLIRWQSRLCKKCHSDGAGAASS